MKIYKKIKATIKDKLLFLFFNLVKDDINITKDNVFIENSIPDNSCNVNLNNNSEPIEDIEDSRIEIPFFELDNNKVNSKL